MRAESEQRHEKLEMSRKKVKQTENEVQSLMEQITHQTTRRYVQSREVG